MTFANRTAFIISHPRAISEILKSKPAIFHIFLVGSYQVRHPNVTVYAGRSLHDNAALISQEMLQRHLVHLAGDAPASQLKEKVAELFANSGSFALSGALLIALENLWQNLAFVPGSYSVDSTRNLFQGIPAIIVASGPSLPKNIHLLDDLRDKAIIVSCGSALRYLARRGIVPHFEIVVDPFPAMHEALKADLNISTCLLMSLMAQHRIAQEFKGAKMYFLVNFDARVLDDIRQYTRIHTVLPAMASVATTALRFALHAGADPIIFIGQDLCYAGEMTHADGSSPAADVCTMAAMDGRQVKSNMALKEAFDFFSSFVPTIKDRKIINATEGGAGMRGADHISLLEAATRYLTRTIAMPALPAQQVDVDHLQTRLKRLAGNFSAMQIKAAGFENKVRGWIAEKRGSSKINEKILQWFQTLRMMAGYEYVARHLDWEYYRAATSDDDQPKLELAGIATRTLKRQTELIHEAQTRMHPPH